MATITPSMDMRERGIRIVWTWANMVANDSGDSVEWPTLADRPVHIYGTWGGASMVMEGSNSGSNWCSLDNQRGAAISVSGDAVVGVAQITTYVRPRVVGGDGTTNLNAVTLARAFR